MDSRVTPSLDESECLGHCSIVVDEWKRGGAKVERTRVVRDARRCCLDGDEIFLFPLVERKDICDWYMYLNIH